VTKLATLLGKDCCGFQVKPVSDPTRQQLENEIYDFFGPAGTDDVLLFYFAGHGEQYPENGSLLLCPQDADSSKLLPTTVTPQTVAQLVKRTKCRRLIFILDCCFSGDAHRDLGASMPSLMRSSLGEVQGKYILTSSSPTQQSYEHEGDEHSLFTKWLINGLETWSADKAPQDGNISVQELAEYTAEMVTKHNPQQTPFYAGYGVHEGEIFVATASGSSESSPPYVASLPAPVGALASCLCDGEIIPVVGTGIYGGGSLGTVAFAQAMASKAQLAVDPASTAATFAEYLEMRHDRHMLLKETRKILQAGTDEYTGTAVHDMICDMGPPWLVLSATLDWTLEERLRGTPHVIVTHILHAENGELEGRVLVMRENDEPTVCQAGEVTLDEKTDRIVYKLLGSPFLNDLALDRSAGAIDVDTTVLTESDYAKFLNLLARDETTVPTVFSPMFMKRYLLFLGYTLDMWQYRLAARAFGKRPKRKRYAVRQPSSVFEERCWKSLRAELITMAPEAFAQAMQRECGAEV
jgi:hypothetical protein